MTAIQLNAEIYESLSIIAKDESLLKKAARALKRLASQKRDETLMTEDAFFAIEDKSLEEAANGETNAIHSKSELSSFLNSL